MDPCSRLRRHSAASAIRLDHDRGPLHFSTGPLRILRPDRGASAASNDRLDRGDGAIAAVRPRLGSSYGGPDSVLISSGHLGIMAGPVR